MFGRLRNINEHSPEGEWGRTPLAIWQTIPRAPTRPGKPGNYCCPGKVMEKQNFQIVLEQWNSD